MAYWRDIHRSTKFLSLCEGEPMTIEDAKDHAKIEVDDRDEWLRTRIPAARRQVELDSNTTLPKSTLEMVFDAFPQDQWIVVPAPPLISVSELAWTDYDGVETILSASTYIVDTHSCPGRIAMKPLYAWPTGARPFQGGRLKWIAGYAAADIPKRFLQAMALLLEFWNSNLGDGQLPGVPELPPGYASLFPDRVLSLG